MFRNLRATVIIATIWVSVPLFASREGILRWSNLTVESPGLDTSGPIKIVGIQDSNQISSLTIYAFGRTFKPTAAQMHHLKEIEFNGVRISYEDGYKDTGGRTIYITFSSGSMSGLQTLRTLVISEFGKIKVINPQVQG